VAKPFDNRVIGSVVRRLTGRDEQGSQEFLRILLVQGDPDLQLEMMSAFRCAWPSAQIKTARDAQAAQVHIADMLPSLLVIDGTGPGGRIEEILGALRRDERCSHTLVLVWTELGAEQVPEGAQRIGQHPNAGALASAAAERWERWREERPAAVDKRRARESRILDASKALEAAGGRLWQVRVLAASLEVALLKEVRQVEEALTRADVHAALAHLRELEERAAHVGGERLGEIARQLWVALMEGRAEGVAGRVATLEAAVRELCSLLNSYQ